MEISTANSAIFRIYRLLLTIFIIFALYFAQAILIPLTLAALLTFLLSPISKKLEKWIGRIFSILLIVVVAFTAIGFAGFVFARQFILFGANFQKYYENIQEKLQALQFPKWEIFNRFEHILGNLKEGLFGESEIAPTLTPTSPAGVNVQLIDLSSYFTDIAKWISGSFFNILGSTGIVLLLVIFMLLKREDILGRIIKLMGQQRIGSTTSTIDDASERVYNYLFRQFIVNIGFGICVSTGLYLIGIPNTILWGCFAAILRFIPYIGSWVAAIIPIAISFIITNTWSVPLLTISFFIILELITAYVVEPFYYGGGTGVSSFALILAAIFWTWLWGPIGLLLSTPLTVCLVVMGQHMPNMKFLSVLLSQEQALTPTEDCYHRLLSFDSGGSIDVIESYLKKDSLISLYDSVLIPIITLAEEDFHLDLIDAEKKERVYQSMREIIEFLSLSEQKETTSTSELKVNVLCLPARTVRDELGVSILAQLLAYKSFEVHQTTNFNVNEIFALVEKMNLDAVCIVVVAPFALSHSLYLCTKLHQRIPQLSIFIVLWGLSELASEIILKLNAAGATKVVFSLSQALETLQEMRSNKKIT